MKRKLSIFLVFLLLLSLFSPSIFRPNEAFAGIPRKTITNFEDWLGVNTYYSDPKDVSGNGQPSDLTGFGITNDDQNLYLRWDLILGNGNFSYNYVTAIAPLGTNTPEIYAYVNVNVDNNGNATVIPKLQPYNGTSFSVETATASFIREGDNVRILATFPFSAFTINGQQKLTSSSEKSIWAGSANNFGGNNNSAFADVVPNGPSSGTGGYLDYDTETGEATPRDTGPLITMKAIAENSVVEPGDPVNYTLFIKNVGNSGGSLSQADWTLPAGFSYMNGSSTINGSTLADPSISAQTLTWSNFSTSTIDANGGIIELKFRAAASQTPNIDYYSTATAVISSATYNTGQSAKVTVSSSTLSPPTLNVSSVGYNNVGLSWTLVPANGSVTVSGYNVYLNGINTTA